MIGTLPAYLTPAQVARANGRYDAEGKWVPMLTQTMRDKLQRAGILEPDGPNRYHVGQSRLRERLPEIHERCVDFYVIEGNPLDGG